MLRQSIACAGRLPRHADVSLAGVCAEHLVDGLRAAGLIVARPVQWRLHPRQVYPAVMIRPTPWKTPPTASAPVKSASCRRLRR